MSVSVVTAPQSSTMPIWLKTTSRKNGLKEERRIRDDAIWGWYCKTGLIEDASLIPDAFGTMAGASAEFGG